MAPGVVLTPPSVLMTDRSGAAVTGVVSVRAVVRGRRVGTVRTVVGDGHGVADLRDAGGNGVRDGDRERARGRGRAGRQGPDDVGRCTVLVRRRSIPPSGRPR